MDGQADGNDGPFTDEARYMVGPGEPPVELTATDADIIWRFDPMAELAVRPHNAASSSVLIHGNMLYVGTANGVDKSHQKVLSPMAPSLIVLDKRTGRLVADGKIYLGNKRELFVLAVGEEPKVLSRIRLGSPLYSTPIAANGLLYVASQRYLWAVGRTDTPPPAASRATSTSR